MSDPSNEISLVSSGCWADEIDPEFFDLVDEFVTESKIITENNLPKTLRHSDSPPPPEENDDKYDAPVIWLKRTYGIPKEIIMESIINAFKSAGRDDVEFIDIFITFSADRDHSYFILNSASASDLLLDGTITVVTTPDNDSMEDQILWFERADHLVPKDNQDPCILFVWGLPKLHADFIFEIMHDTITKITPIVGIEINEDEKNMCDGSIKIYFYYMFDAQKCLYMLNFNRILFGSEVAEIRASYCNTDRIRKDKISPGLLPRTAHPRKAGSKSKFKHKKKKQLKPKPIVPIVKTDDTWTVVGREGRKF